MNYNYLKKINRKILLSTWLVSRLIIFLPEKLNAPNLENKVFNFEKPFFIKEKNYIENTSIKNYFYNKETIKPKDTNFYISSYQK